MLGTIVAIEKSGIQTAQPRKEVVNRKAMAAVSENIQIGAFSINLTNVSVDVKFEDRGRLLIKAHKSDKEGERK
jgi:hypothetical protein